MGRGLAASARLGVNGPPLFYRTIKQTTGTLPLAIKQKQLTRAATLLA